MERPCIGTQLCNSHASWMNSCFGARPPTMCGRRPRPGGGGRRTRRLACKTRCRRNGALVSDCLRAPLTPTALGYSSNPLPARPCRRGPEIFRASRRIRIRVRRRRDTSSEVRFGFERRPGLAVASPATGCSGGETCIGADCQKVPTGKRGFADLRIKFFG